MFTQVSVGTLYMSFFYFFCPYARVFVYVLLMLLITVIDKQKKRK